MINKQEIKYIIFATLFALLWFAFLLPIISDKIDGTSPYLQFLLFNVGLFVFFQLFLKSMTLSTSTSIKSSLGLIVLFLVLDIFAPPYAVGFQGELLKGPILIESSTDYVVGYLATNMGLRGILITLFTYALVPLILLIAAAKILPNFIRHL